MKNYSPGAPLTKQSPSNIYLLHLIGVVTKAKMATVPSQVWAEGRVYSADMNGQLLNALMRYHEAGEADKKASLIWQSVHGVTVVVFFYCAPVDNPPVFRCFNDIPCLTRLVEPGCRSVYDVVEGFASLNPVEPKWYVSFVLFLGAV